MYHQDSGVCHEDNEVCHLPESNSDLLNFVVKKFSLLGTNFPQDLF